MGLAFALPQVIRNEILAGLTVEDFSQLRPHLTRVRLVPGQVLVEPGQIVQHVFFIEEGMVSLIADGSSARSSAQLAMIGRDGFVGSQVLLAPEQVSEISAISQIPGPAVRVPAAELARFTASRPAVRDLFMGYIQQLMQQSLQTAASNMQNNLLERCVRWLLMAHDRIDGDELPITHEALSVMLGVRRSGVTVVLAGLQEQGLVQVGRGRIGIIDRVALERAARGQGWQVTSPPSPRRLAGSPDFRPLQPGQTT